MGHYMVFYKSGFFLETSVLENMGDLKRTEYVTVRKNKTFFAIKNAYLGLKNWGDVFREQNARILMISFSWLKLHVLTPYILIPNTPL